MKVIDLLNKIANGEEVPEKINYLGIEYKLMHQDYKDESRDIYLFSEEIRDILDILNDTVEIIEDTKDINIQDIEHKELEIIQENLGKCDLWKGNEEYILKVINENNSRLVDAILQVSKENGVLVQAVKQLDKTKEDK